VVLMDKDGTLLESIVVDDANSHSRLWCI